jgi:KDO2-lipid IV(A) lauroyltransferase
MEPALPEARYVRTGRKARRSRGRKNLSRGAQYVLIRAGHALLSRLPLALGRATGAVIGTFAWFVLRRERAIARLNLRSAFADLSPREVRAVAQSSLRHMITVMIEWLILRRWPREKLRARFPETAAKIEELSQVFAREKGVVGITAHFGNWELLSLFFGHFAPGMLVPVARRIKFEPTHRFLHRLRAVAGMEIFYTDTSARHLIRAVRSGKVPGFLPDQDVRTNSGIFVPFFGRPAYTATFPVRLARKTGTRCITAYLVREGGGFRVVAGEPFAVDGDNEDEALARATERWSAILEAEIRKRPAQWIWCYPRWRTSTASPRRHRPGRKSRAD